ncbi:MAG: hypothetical protein ISS25_04120 [Nanoarchaeota archaeon]|nr:hypothetical protein [DPANN group archaeon]MBL7116987.1 hypothetical protein [Nanoarchaeota archaeon]
MVDLDIAPPPPPKFFKEKKKKEEPLPSVEEKQKVHEDAPKKKGFLKKLFAKKEISKISKKEVPKPEEEFDLEKIRSDFGIPAKEEKKEVPPEKPTKKEKPKGWDHGDIIDEFHKPKEKGPRWDVEEPDHLKEPSKPKVSAPKKPKKKVAVRKPVKKVAVKKPIKKVAPKKVVKPKKPVVVKKQVVKKAKLKKSKIDKVVEKYFKSVEREQQLIQKELDEIVVHPKKALKKGPTEYIIHHNEKLINSMKELMAAIKNIDDEKFETRVQANKKAFYNWVKGILEKEKKAEQQRNQILKQKVKELLKEYGNGINKDIIDKKYELDAEKKDADKRTKKAEQFELRLKKFEARLKQNEKELNNLIEEGIKKVIDKRLKKESIAMKRAETRARNLVAEYNSKSEQLKNERLNFNKRMNEAKELLEQGEALKRKKEYLERKDAKLRKDIEELKAKDKELKKQTEELEARDKYLLSKDKKLAADVKKLEAKNEGLLQKEKELKLEIRDFETRKKEFELREHEVKEIEDHVVVEREDLHEIKESLMFREKEAKEKLKEVKKIEHDIVEMEEKHLLEDRKKIEDLDFRKYLHAKLTDMSEEEPEVNKMVEEFYIMIENCRNMVKNHQLNDAKRLYNDIKAKFSRTDLNPRNKEILYNSIRELYDDIYLAVIS